MAMETMDDQAIRAFWLQEEKAEAKQNNPLNGFCERVFFIRNDCIQRSGKNKGKKRRYRNHEIELLRFLPSRRCVTVKDLATPGLDALAEEILSNSPPPPEPTRHSSS
jgi:hypothetical protein